MCSLNNHASQLAHNPTCRCSFKSANLFFPSGKTTVVFFSPWKTVVSCVMQLDTYHYRTQLVYRKIQTLWQSLENTWKTLCRVWLSEKKSRQLYIDNDFFVEYFLSNTRLKICRTSPVTRQRKFVVMVLSKWPTDPLLSVLRDTRQNFSFDWVFTRLASPFFSVC